MLSQKRLTTCTHIAHKDAEVAASVVSLSWVQDGVDGPEPEAIDYLYSIAYRDAEVAASIVSLSWVQDGVDDPETGLIEEFASIAYEDASAALRIVGMPFLENYRTVRRIGYGVAEAACGFRASVVPERHVPSDDSRRHYQQLGPGGRYAAGGC